MTQEPTLITDPARTFQGPVDYAERFASTGFCLAYVSADGG